MARYFFTSRAKMKKFTRHVFRNHKCRNFCNVTCDVRS
ncbi:DUF1661 domain-containing protein [Porphyromonas gingivalis]|uniref:DUF1661 domain-containing protein n=1 Tax=Porphyromonas gingivalis TaxID=837 RepID=A0AAF0BFJ4_PORGN|nr:DUF1661 domain-containing protein [Porphyromonas gingivalis]WCG02931.1 DUF1661 domain-containing protein [Porphyromonas gingivalis]